MDDCFANNTCWPEDRLERYRRVHGDTEGVPVFSILTDPDISIVDKMWAVEAAELLSEDDMHWLALDFAAHVMTEANIEGMNAIKAKEAWMKGNNDEETLHKAELAAWKESKNYHRSKAAAYASKTNATIALRGAAALSAGAYGEDVDPIEKRWQWGLIKERLGLKSSQKDVGL